MNDISWDFYRTFLAVLRLGSLSAAARDLGLTQPTVGRHIDALEQALGHQLFTRSQQGLLPTEPALAMKPYAENLAITTAAMQRLASGEIGAVKGTVRISASEVIGVEILPPILASLQDQHPGLELELSLSDSLEDLLRRESDIAVRMTSPVQDALVTRHIGDIPLGLFAHRRYLDRHGVPQSPDDLAAHRLIGFDRRTAFVRAAADRIRATSPPFPISKISAGATRRTTISRNWRRSAALSASASARSALPVVIRIWSGCCPMFSSYHSTPGLPCMKT